VGDVVNKSVIAASVLCVSKKECESECTISFLIEWGKQIQEGEKELGGSEKALSLRFKDRDVINSFVIGTSYTISFSPTNSKPPYMK
jgi:hypothetical protein